MIHSRYENIFMQYDMLRSRKCTLENLQIYGNFIQTSLS